MSIAVKLLIRVIMRLNPSSFAAFLRNAGSRLGTKLPKDPKVLGQWIETYAAENPSKFAVFLSVLVGLVDSDTFMWLVDRFMDEEVITSEDVEGLKRKFVRVYSPPEWTRDSVYRSTGDGDPDTIRGLSGEAYDLVELNKLDEILAPARRILGSYESILVLQAALLSVEPDEIKALISWKEST